MNAKTPAQGEGLGESGNLHQLTATASTAPYVLADDQRHPSRLAYEKATARGVPEVRAAILRLLGEHGPMTDDALHRLYLDSGHERRSRQRIGTARHELVEAGKVREAGRGRSDAGNAASLWEVVHDDGDG